MPETLKIIQGQAVADAWNECHEVGCRVILINDDGERDETETESKAWPMNDGASVVMVKSRAGCYDLERIIPKPIIRSTMSIQEAIDINTGARCMAFQEAAKLCAGHEDVEIGPMGLAVELLGLAHYAEPEGRDLELDWDPELAALCDEWRAR